MNTFVKKLDVVDHYTGTPLDVRINRIAERDNLEIVSIALIRNEAYVVFRKGGAEQ